MEKYKVFLIRNTKVDSEFLIGAKDEEDLKPSLPWPDCEVKEVPGFWTDTYKEVVWL